MAGTFMSEAERVENSKGFEDDSVFIYNRGVIRCLNDLLEKYPDYLPYLRKREELEAKLEKHPMNFKTEVQTKIVRHQVITGKGYEGGIDIFAAYSKKKNTKAQESHRAYQKRWDFPYRIGKRTEIPLFLRRQGIHSYYFENQRTKQITLSIKKERNMKIKTTYIHWILVAVLLISLPDMAFGSNQKKKKEKKPKKGIRMGLGW